MSLSDPIEQRFGTAGTVTGDAPFLRQMLTRRSIRAFRPDPVPEPLLTGLLAAGLSAPSKSDLQQVSVIRLTAPAARKALADLLPQFPWIADAPALLVFCGDGRRIRRLAGHRGHPFANEHLDSFTNAAVDAGIALATTLYAAESAGLGGCPISVIRNRVQEVSALLALPQHVFPLAGLCLGWPEETPPLRRRLPLSVTLHTDRYNDDGLLDAVENYDRARAAAEPVPEDKQHNRARWGTAALYGWSEHRTRQYAEPAREDWGRYVRSQGFDLS
ncbi:MAG: nitroreductase family protein [Rhodospirillales bacterium]|nr:nitroreductase family protein [Rhodospirillales bacterium]